MAKLDKILCRETNTHPTILTDRHLITAIKNYVLLISYLKKIKYVENQTF